MKHLNYKTQPLAKDTRIWRQSSRQFSWRLFLATLILAFSFPFTVYASDSDLLVVTNNVVVNDTGSPYDDCTINPADIGFPFPTMVWADLLDVANNGSIVQRNSEAESYLAVNPTDPDNIIVVYQTDRLSIGASVSLSASVTFNGGNTWQQIEGPFGYCSEETLLNRTLVSDPWIDFTNDGKAIFMALSISGRTGLTYISVSISEDGGLNWSDGGLNLSSEIIISTVDSHDKNTLTTDPVDPNLVYATWSLNVVGGRSSLFTRSSDGGVTWEAEKTIINPSDGGPSSTGMQIEVLKDGSLLNVFAAVDGDFIVDDERSISVVRSTDKGDTWSEPIIVADTRDGVFRGILQSLVKTPVTEELIRASENRNVDIAADLKTGRVYIVFQDFNDNKDEFGDDAAKLETKLCYSKDGGLTWLPSAKDPDVPSRCSPITVSTDDPTNHAFFASVAVLHLGDEGEHSRIGVMHYSLQNATDTVDNTDLYLSMFDKNGKKLSQVRVTPESFDINGAALSLGNGYMLTDYTGLRAADGAFHGTYVATVQSDPCTIPVPVFGIPGPGEYNPFFDLGRSYDISTNCQDVFYTRIDVVDSALVCHVPDGNFDNAHEIQISTNALDAHLNNHNNDCLGDCSCLENDGDSL